MIGYEDIEVGGIVVCPSTGETFRVVAVHPQELTVISNHYGAQGVLHRYQFIEGHFRRAGQ